MRAVGTLTGGPPIVRYFRVSANVPAAGGAVGDVVMYDQSAGKIDVADYNDSTWLAGANLDQIDDDKITQVVPATATWDATNGDSLCGILAGAVTASQTALAPVFVFHSSVIFEANLTSLVDGDTAPTALTSLVSHVGSHFLIAAADVDLSWDAVTEGGVTKTVKVPNGVWVLSDTPGAGTTGEFARVIEAGYGFTGEDVLTGHGVIGDANIRVRFVVEPAATFLGV